MFFFLWSLFGLLGATAPLLEHVYGLDTGDDPGR
jgi:hypothetical protein